MRIEYTSAAFEDMRDIIHFGVMNHLPDPVAFVRQLRDRFSRLAEIEHPGRKGRVAGTREWVVSGTPYIAVFSRTDDAITVLRVLHGAQQWPK
jgi:toxin ParE1/3/4